MQEQEEQGQEPMQEQGQEGQVPEQVPVPEPLSQWDLFQLFASPQQQQQQQQQQQGVHTCDSNLPLLFLQPDGTWWIQEPYQ